MASCLFLPLSRVFNGKSESRLGCSTSHQAGFLGRQSFRCVFIRPRDNFNGWIDYVCSGALNESHVTASSAPYQAMEEESVANEYRDGSLVDGVVYEAPS